MEPVQFRTKWNLTNEQMAQVLDLSTGHVNCWFFKPSATRYRKPSDGDKNRLLEIDYLWSQLKRYPPHVVKRFSDFTITP